MEDDSGGGDIGGGKRCTKKKLPNPLKQEQKLRSLNPTPQIPEIEDIEEPQRVFKDGSRLVLDLTENHLDLLGRIDEQKEEDCWARALGRILEFIYNKDINEVAERKPLSIDGLISHVVLEKVVGPSHGENLAVSSLRRAIKFIKETGLQKGFGRNQGDSTFKVKGKFRTESKANSDHIINLLQSKGPVGIYVHMIPEFIDLKDEIFTLEVPQAQVVENYRRHVLIIVGYGLTKDGQIFFLAQNTWGKGWGVRGYGRIMIAETCPIFYLDQLV